MIISILIGIIPDVTFFTLFNSFLKNLKTKRVKLFLMIFVSYLLCITIKRYNLLYYTLFIGAIFMSLKVLYKEETEMLDLVIVTAELSYILICSWVSSILFKNNINYYYFALILNKVLILMPLLLKNRLNKMYQCYIKLWDRRFLKKRIFKSITVRNVSAIFLCIALIAVHTHILSIV